MPSFSDLTLPEFDDEIARTRVVLSSIPEDKLEWKLDEKFQTIAWNATHIANIIEWTAGIIEKDFFDIAPIDGPTDQVNPLTSVQEILRQFDDNARVARKHLSEATDELLEQDWSLKMGDQTLFTMSKRASIRKWVLNHSIHHRGILSVYLRMCGVDLTPVYDS